MTDPYKHQREYKQSEKGRKKQYEAVARHKEKIVSWQTTLSPEASDKVESKIPDGMSKADFLRSLLQPYLDD